MRIAQIAPLWETIPPKSYGGTELIVSLLSEELVRQGHEVTVFAAATSETNARVVPCSEVPLRLLPEIIALENQDSSHNLYPGSGISLFYELRQLENVFSQAHQFDVIHNHLGFPALPFAGFVKTPVLTTLHGAFTTKTLHSTVEQQYYDSYAHLPFVSISDYQRIPGPNLNYTATVYHGLDVEQYQPSFSWEDKTYLAFLGRFCRDKGPHLAIRMAKETGWPLIMAGKVDCEEEHDYFRQEIAPHIDDQQIRYVGELNHPQKVDLLRHAAATLCPVTWPEPFGLVLIESMACGTPVLALKNGSIPEIIRHQETGFVSETVEELTEWLGHLKTLDRQVCRNHVVQNFSKERMTENYVKVYRQLVENSKMQCYPSWQDEQILRTPFPGKTSFSVSQKESVSF